MSSFMMRKEGSPQNFLNNGSLERCKMMYLLDKTCDNRGKMQELSHQIGQLLELVPTRLRIRLRHYAFKLALEFL